MNVEIINGLTLKLKHHVAREIYFFFLQVKIIVSLPDIHTCTLWMDGWMGRDNFINNFRKVILKVKIHIRIT